MPPNSGRLFVRTESAEKLLSIRAAAKRLGMTRWAVYKMVRRGVLPGHVVRGRLKVSLADLQSAEFKGRRQPGRPLGAEKYLERNGKIMVENS